MFHGGGGNSCDNSVCFTHPVVAGREVDADLIVTWVDGRVGLWCTVA